VNRQAATYTPKVRNAILKSLDVIKKSVPDAEIERLIANGRLNDAVFTIFDAAESAKPWYQVQIAVQQVLRAGMESTARVALPAAARHIGFNVLSPTVRGTATDLSEQLVQPFARDVRAGLQKIIALGVQNHLEPDAVVKLVKASVGVGPGQADQIANFRGMLEARDRGALSRTLRNKGFDAKIRSAFADGRDLTSNQIDAMVSDYAENMAAFNAGTVSRTAALQTLKASQHAAWEEAIDSGVVDESLLLKRWVGVMDSRERDEHVAMEGEVRPFSALYSNKEMVPGDSTFNCRCVSYVWQAASQREYQIALAA
jgi:hypothetical protein